MKRAARGQALVEYVLVLLLAVVALIAPVDSQGRSVVELSLQGVRIYFDSFNYLLGLPIP
jgi:hypothetical protein